MLHECGQEVPITRPLYGKQSLFADGDLGLALATYEAHPRRPTDAHSCSAVSKTVPQYQMRKAHSTTPGEGLLLALSRFASAATAYAQSAWVLWGGR